MGMNIDAVEVLEKDERKKLLNAFLKPHGLTEEDVKDLSEKSKYAVSMKKSPGEIEYFVLYEKIATSDTFRVNVDYDFALENNPKPPVVNRKQRRAKKK